MNEKVIDKIVGILNTGPIETPSLEIIEDDGKFLGIIEFNNPVLGTGKMLWRVITPPLPDKESCEEIYRKFIRMVEK